MAKRILFFAFLFVLSALAHAAPTVWEQMEHGMVHSSRGVVKAVDIVGEDVYVKVETKDSLGDIQIQHDRLCTLKDGVDLSLTDEMRATVFRAKIDLLQEARRTGHPIEYGTQGVWKSCVSYLRALEG